MFKYKVHIQQGRRRHRRPPSRRGFSQGVPGRLLHRDPVGDEPSGRSSFPHGGGIIDAHHNKTVNISIATIFTKGIIQGPRPPTPTRPRPPAPGLLGMARKSADLFTAMARNWSGLFQEMNFTWSVTSARAPLSAMRISGYETVANIPESV